MTDTTLIVIAVATTVQALVTIGALIAAVVAWRRLQVKADESMRALTARIDEALAHAREAADSVHRVSDRASSAMGQAGQVIGAVSAFASAPKTIAAAGVVSAARWWMARRRRSRTTSGD